MNSKYHGYKSCSHFQEFKIQRLKSIDNITKNFFFYLEYLLIGLELKSSRIWKKKQIS